MDQKSLAMGYLTLATGHAILNDPIRSRDKFEDCAFYVRWYMRAKTAVVCAAAGTAVYLHATADAEKRGEVAKDLKSLTPVKVMATESVVEPMPAVVVPPQEPTTTPHD